MSDFLICDSCKRLYGDCPLHGMTDGMDYPLEGHMLACIHFLSENHPLTPEQISAMDKVIPSGLYCHVCGNKNIVHESPAEGYYCPLCCSSDMEE